MCQLRGGGGAPGSGWYLYEKTLRRIIAILFRVTSAYVVRHLSFQAGDMVLARATYLHGRPVRTINIVFLTSHFFPKYYLHCTIYNACIVEKRRSVPLSYNTTQTTPRKYSTTSKAFLRAISISSALTRTDQTRNAVQRQQRLTKRGQAYKTCQLEDNYARRCYSIRPIPPLGGCLLKRLARCLLVSPTVCKPSNPLNEVTSRYISWRPASKELHTRDGVDAKKGHQCEGTKGKNDTLVTLPIKLSPPTVDRLRPQPPTRQTPPPC